MLRFMKQLGASLVEKLPPDPSHHQLRQSNPVCVFFPSCEDNDISNFLGELVTSRLIIGRERV